MAHWVQLLCLKTSIPYKYPSAPFVRMAGQIRLLKFGLGNKIVGRRQVLITINLPKLNTKQWDASGHKAGIDVTKNRKKKQEKKQTLNLGLNEQAKCEPTCDREELPEKLPKESSITITRTFFIFILAFVTESHQPFSLKEDSVWQLDFSSNFVFFFFFDIKGETGEVMS